MARSNVATAVRSTPLEKAESDSTETESPLLPEIDGGIDSAIRNELRKARIAEAAYYRSLERGDGPGSAAEDWVAAEEDIDLQLLLY